MADWEQAIARQPGCSLQYLRQPNRGPAAARNTGTIRARGEFIQYLDSDDLLLPHKLSRQVTTLRSNPDAAMCSGLTLYLDSRGQEIERFGRPPTGVTQVDMVTPQFDTISPLWRREPLRQAGPWDESLSSLENWEHRARVVRRYGGGIFAAEPVCVHRLHGGERISRHGTDRFAQSNREVILKLERLLDPQEPGDVQARGELSRQMFGVFKALMHAGNAPLAAAALKDCHRLAEGPRRLVMALTMLGCRVLPHECCRILLAAGVSARQRLSRLAVK